MIPITVFSIPSSQIHRLTEVKAKLYPRKWFQFSLAKKENCIASGSLGKNKMIFVQARENFLTAGNILITSTPKAGNTDPQKVWAIGNPFVVFLFIIAILQIMLLGSDLGNYVNAENISLGNGLTSQYFLGKIIRFLLPILVFYTLLYFNLVLRSRRFWKKFFYNQ